MAVINGTPADDNLQGGNDADTINGDDGNDVITGAGGRDQLVGGAGNDSLAGENGEDFLDGGIGDDTLLGGAGIDALIAGAGNDLMDGGDSGFDSADYRGSPAGIVVDLVLGTALDGFGTTDAILGIEELFGSGFADSIVGRSVPESLRGGAGADTLFGNDGSDSIASGAGDDSIAGGNDNDIVLGEGGIDTVDFGGSRAAFTVSFGILDERVNDGISRQLSEIRVAQNGNGPLGQDTLQLVERLSFEDVVIVVPSFVTIRDAFAVEGNDGTSSLIFEVNLTAASTQPVSVQWSTAAGTATADEDFVPATGNLTIPAGENTAQIVVPVIVDTAVEPYETLSVVLSNPTGARFLGGIDTRTAIGTIVNDDGGFSATDDVANTIATTATIAIGQSIQGNIESSNDRDLFRTTLQAGVTYEINVEGAPTEDGSLPDSVARLLDSVGTELVFRDDTISSRNTLLTFTPESSGDFYVSVGGFGGITGSYRLTLSGPSDLPAVSISDFSMIEGDAGGAIALFTVSRSFLTSVATSVTVTTSSGTAIAGQDFTQTSTVVTLPAQAANATIAVPILVDKLVEDDETFTLTLSNPVNAVLGADTTAVGTILNDDSVQLAPVLSIANASIAEGNTGASNLVFTIDLSGPAGQAVSVTASTQNGSALAGADYVATATVVTIPAGQTSATMSVPINGDTALEIDEAFFVNLSNPTGGGVISASAGAAIGTIINNDQAVLPAIDGQSINGTGADDFLVGTALNDSITGNAGNDTEFGNEQSDVLFGSGGNDFIVADFPANFAFGSADFVDAGSGNDNVFAGGGDDTVFGDTGNDLIAGDTGNNLLFGGDGDNALFGFDGADTILGGNNGDIVFGLSGPDVIVTQGGLDLIIAGGPADGDADADFIDMGAGGGSVFAGSGNDTILGGNGSDFMLGESGNDLMRGGGGSDVLIAGNGNDVLDGGASSDILIAEGGDDTLTGGAGGDLFRYPANIAVGNDTILDFTAVDDAVELAASLGFANGAAALAAVSDSVSPVLTLPNGGSITFVGLDAGTLTPADFVIV